MKNKFGILTLFLLCCASLSAQDKGQVSVSVESINQYYESDKETGAQKPNDAFGSNSYVDVKYFYENFNIGARLESYNPALQGYSNIYNKTDIANKYVNYRNNFINITAGNFYEQFGNGLLFRSFEERALGIDNSIEGLNVMVTPIEGISVKGIIGKQRKGFETSNGKIRGIDGTIAINDILLLKNFPNLSVGFSALNKYETYTGPEEDFPTSVNAFSGRLSIEGTYANLDVEYASKEHDQVNLLDAKNGNALLINTGIYIGDLSVNANFRRLERMEFKSERDFNDNLLNINYLPTLTKQHKYSLSNIYMYATQAEAEIGYQIEMFYKFKKKTLFGGKYGTFFNLNFGKYNALNLKENRTDYQFLEFGQSYFTDFSIEMTKKINKSLKTIFTYNYSEYHKGVIEHAKDLVVKPHIVCADILYKVSKTNSIRTELQHLWNNNDQKNWLAGLLEFSFAPSYTVFLQDDFNYQGDKETHYYNFGASYIKNTTRIALSYGRTRGGISCVGGICKYLPAMKGFSLTITSKL
jgi:hypothetical protein